MLLHEYRVPQCDDSAPYTITPRRMHKIFFNCLCKSSASCKCIWRHQSLSYFSVCCHKHPAYGFWFGHQELHISLNTREIPSRSSSRRIVSTILIANNRSAYLFLLTRHVLDGARAVATATSNFVHHELPSHARSCKEQAKNVIL